MLSLSASPAGNVFLKVTDYQGGLVPEFQACRADGACFTGGRDGTMTIPIERHTSLVVTHPAFFSEFIEVDPGSRPLHLRLHPGAMVQGVVRTESGLPLGGVEVRCANATAITADNGRFTLAAITLEGSFPVTCRAQPESSTRWQCLMPTVRAESGKTIEQNLTAYELSASVKLTLAKEISSFDLAVLRDGKNVPVQSFVEPHSLEARVPSGRVELVVTGRSPKRKTNQLHRETVELRAGQEIQRTIAP